jgi:hypothetical protein
VDNQEHIHNQLEKAYKEFDELHDRMAEIWAEHILFTWEWWLGILLTILPWVLWFIFHKKESTGRLLAAGLFVICISSFLDILGVALGFWHYHLETLPLIPAHTPWNITLLPVIVMALLQCKPYIHPLLKAAVFTVLSAYIGEPFAQWIGLYDPEKWKHIYSVPGYFILYMTAHYIAFKLRYKEISA